MNRPELPSGILGGRIIAVARGLDARSAPNMARAITSGGLSVLEVTLERPSGLAALESLSDSDCVVGAGSVTSLSQAKAAVRAGARFLVTPHLATEVVEWSVSQGIAVVPGCFSPTEVHTAWSMGVSAVKLFPASVVGPSMVLALLGPFPDLRLIPTGGISIDNAPQYLSAGAVAVAVGGWLTSHQDPEEVRRRAEALTEAVADRPSR